MSSTSHPPDARDEEVRAQLESLRDNPVERPADDVLILLFDYLMRATSQFQSSPHWFCEQASPLTVEAATFLLRLRAYGAPQVLTWTTNLKACLLGCAGCVKSLEEAKMTSRSTYFGAFSDSLVDSFFLDLGNWQASIITEALEHMRAELSSTTKQSEIPSAIVYQMVANLNILQDGNVYGLLSSNPPKQRFSSWPLDPPPVGLLTLLVCSNAELRDWAAQCLSPRAKMPIPLEQFGSQYRAALSLVLSALDSISTAPSLFLSSDQAELWKGARMFLQQVPSEVMLSTNQSMSIRRLVVRHLHDTGPQFTSILQTFLLTMKRLGREIWNGEGSDHPRAAFDTIKENESFLELLSSPDRPPWLLGYFSEFMYAMRGLPSYGDVLGAVADFMWEELQEERFLVSRPAILSSAIQLLTSAFQSTLPDDDGNHQSKATAGALDLTQHHESVMAVLDTHSDAIITVGFDRAYSDSKWADPRKGARKLVKSLLAKDIRAIRESAKIVFRGSSPQRPYPKLRKQYWEKTYSCMHMEDHSALTLLIELISQLAYLSPINQVAFERYWGSRKPKTPSSEDRFSLEQINKHFSFIYSGIFGVVDKYTCRYISDDFDFDVLNTTDDLVPSLTFMVLSPVNDVSQSAQCLISSAFNVDGRQACFRVLLSRHFHPAMKGIVRFLHTFTKYSASTPDACDLATSLVRCFTDIVEVLCTHVEGLLCKPNFFSKSQGEQAAADLFSLWFSMVSANCNIFSYARVWATLHDSDMMIKWMRDALIFGRDLLAHRAVMESAIVSAKGTIEQSSKTHRSVEVRKKMIHELQPFLPQLAKWLRLTDEELLYQSFALIESVLGLFHDSGSRPSKDGLDKLWKVVTDTKGGGRTAPRLDAERLSKLEETLASFEDVVSALPKKPMPTVAPKAEKPSVSKKSVSKNPEATSKSVMTVLKDAHKSSTKSLSKQHIPQTGARKPSFAQQQGRSYTDDDSAPTFRRASSSSAASSSSTRGVVRRKSSEPKNEGSTSATPHETESSSSGDSDSEDDQPADLTALSKVQRVPHVKKPAERRSVKMMDGPGVAHRRTQPAYDREHSRRVQGRLNPNISKLYRVLLSWNYDDTTPQPPQSEGTPKPLPIPDRFTDYSHYVKTFEPLFFMECWSQLLRSKEEISETFQCIVTDRSYVDDWIDIKVLVKEGVPKSWRLMETDVVLLKGPTNKRSVMAKATELGLKHQPFGALISLRCYFANMARDDPGLSINTSWQLSKVFSLSTIAREYAAMVSVPCFDQCDTILRPRLPELRMPNTKEVERAMQSFQVNKPQATAILSSLATPGFSLIQGPPGTGKTATICALVRLYLSRQPQPINTPTNPQVVVTQKVLLCAPSNAAIDEVAKRVRDSFRGTNYSVVRIGADAAIGNATKDISLDSLIDEALASENINAKKEQEMVNSLTKALTSIKEKRQQKQEEMSHARDNAPRMMALEQEIQQLGRRRGEISTELDRARDALRSAQKDDVTDRRRKRSEIIAKAHVICATLSGAGHESLRSCDVGLIIIDEAAQAIELSSLIPFRFGFQHCVMVGDSKQLPPTVISQEATRLKYNQSLFVRLQNQNPQRVHLLSIQYRMHPEISQLPSDIFYGGRLEDGPSMAQKTEKPWHSHPKFGVYRFFDVKGGVEEQVGQSQRNRSESQVALSLFQCLRRDYSSVDFTVGVVTMYKAQVFELRRQFEQQFGRGILNEVDFNTVDGFQGQEKDVIILSCVRAGPGLQRVGFVADVRRMNVALTRAKSSVFILGNASTLERSDETWRSIVQNARTRSLLTEVDASYFKAGTTYRAPAKVLPAAINGLTDVTSRVQIDTPMSKHTPPAVPAVSDLSVSQVITPPVAGSHHVNNHEPACSESLASSVAPSAPPRVSKRPAENEPPPDSHTPPPNGSDPSRPRIPQTKRQRPSNNLFITSNFRKNNSVLTEVAKRP